jgi:asparagine synthase (glutamine-hydrolysing)
MAFDLHGYLPDDILVKVDRAAMAVALETRAPFLDAEVARFAWGLPAALRGRAGRGKPVLRSLLGRFVPPTLFERPKRGFGLPIDRWLRSELKPLGEKYLLHTAARYDYLLNPEGIRQLWCQHQSGRVNRQRELWTLIALLMWLEKNV